MLKDAPPPPSQTRAPKQGALVWGQGIARSLIKYKAAIYNELSGFKDIRHNKVTRPRQAISSEV